MIKLILEKPWETDIPSSWAISQLFFSILLYYSSNNSTSKQRTWQTRLCIYVMTPACLDFCHMAARIKYELSQTGNQNFRYENGTRTKKSHRTNVPGEVRLPSMLHCATVRRGKGVVGLLWQQQVGRSDGCTGDKWSAGVKWCQSSDRRLRSGAGGRGFICHSNTTSRIRSWLSHTQHARRTCSYLL